MRYLLSLFVVSLFLIPSSYGQGFAYGVKGGMTIGTQKWDNNINRDPLFRYHGILFIESAAEENEFAIFGQVGYHVKGSAIRTNAFVGTNVNGNFVDFPARTTAFEFRNVSLTFGGKKKYDFASSSKAYYMLGVRGEYTVSTNLSEFEIQNQYFPIFPFPENVRNINYGVTVGGGLEFPMGEYLSGIVEFSVNPDFSRQYESPPLQNISVPNQPGQTRNLPERRIVNNTFELSFGIRLLRLVEYID